MKLPGNSYYDILIKIHSPNPCRCVTYTLISRDTITNEIKVHYDTNDLVINDENKIIQYKDSLLNEYNKEVVNQLAKHGIKFKKGYLKNEYRKRNIRNY